MDTSKIILNNTLKIYIGIVLYFFLMKLMGLENVSELRTLNFLIVIWGTNTAVKQNIFKNNNNAYLKNLSIAFLTSVFSVLTIAFSLVFYVNFINYDIIYIMENSTFWGSNLSLGQVVFTILIEGLASSIIGSFMIMQYWKKHKERSLA